MARWRWRRHGDEPRARAPRPDRVVEVAWLPLWQAQLVLHELHEREIPCSMSEDHTSHLRFGAKGPMARIYVMEPRLESTRAIIEELIGVPPPRLDS